MSVVKHVEKRIRNVEGFAVVIRHLDGRDVRSDKSELPIYRYRRAANDALTVAEWRDTRFKPSHPGFRVEVLDGCGDEMHGKTKIGNVRATYR